MEKQPGCSCRFIAVAVPTTVSEGGSSEISEPELVAVVYRAHRPIMRVTVAVPKAVSEAVAQLGIS